MARSAAGMSTTTVRSFRAAGKKIARAARSLRSDVMGPGLRMIGEEILTDVKNAYPGHGVPVKDGHLRGSGRAEGPTGPEHAPQVSLSFGGAAAPYALYQHEITTLRHPVGEPRYLVRGLERWHESTSPAMALMRKKANDALDQEQRGG